DLGHGLLALQGFAGPASPGRSRGWGGRPRPGRRQDVSTSERRSAVAYRPRHRCTPNRQLRPNGPPLADPSSSLPLLLFVLRSWARIPPPCGGSTPQQSGPRPAGRTQIPCTAATDPAWKKWLPGNPTCPHWYTPEHLERLVSAYIAHDLDAGKAR